MTRKAFALAVGICLALSTASGSANPSSLRQGSSGAAVNGSIPGEVLWAYYQTLVLGQVCPPPPAPFEDVLCNTESSGDNIIRLVNPNGGADGNLAGVKPQPVCAMIFVFDDDEEMGECCGCPLSSAQLATFSVIQNLTSNWGIRVARGRNRRAGRQWLRRNRDRRRRAKCTSLVPRAERGLQWWLRSNQYPGL